MLGNLSVLSLTSQTKGGWSRSSSCKSPWLEGSMLTCWHHDIMLTCHSDRALDILDILDINALRPPCSGQLRAAGPARSTSGRGPEIA